MIIATAPPPAPPPPPPHLHPSIFDLNLPPILMSLLRPTVSNFYFITFLFLRNPFPFFFNQMFKNS